MEIYSLNSLNDVILGMMQGTTVEGIRSLGYSGYLPLQSPLGTNKSGSGRRLYSAWASPLAPQFPSGTDVAQGHGFGVLDFGLEGQGDLVRMFLTLPVSQKIGPFTSLNKKYSLSPPHLLSKV